MSYAEVSRFVRDLKQDPVLLEQLCGGHLGLEGLVGHANQRGYTFTASEARSFADAQKDPGAELEMVGSDEPDDPGLPALISIMNQPVVIEPVPSPVIKI